MDTNHSLHMCGPGHLKLGDSKAVQVLHQRHAILVCNPTGYTKPLHINSPVPISMHTIHLQVALKTVAEFPPTMVIISLLPF